MKHVSILIPKGAILGSIEGPRQLIQGLNNYLREMGKAPMFEIQLVGLVREVQLGGGLYTIHSDVLLGDVKKTDLIIIPAIDGDLEQALVQNKDFVPFITSQYKAGAEVASLCLGAFLLASTGLLNGRKCATHWM